MVSKGMLPVKYLVPKILMAVNYCGRQLAQRLGWTTPAYHNKEGATPHSGTCKFSLQYDRRHYGSFGMQVWTWNLGSLSGTGEVCEELIKRMIDVGCLQEVRWRGQGDRMLGMKGRRYKLWWSGKEVDGVGVIVKEEVVEIGKVIDRVNTVGVVF